MIFNANIMLNMYRMNMYRPNIDLYEALKYEIKPSVISLNMTKESQTK